MNYIVYKNNVIWTRVNYDGAYGFQCVDLIRDYIKNQNRTQPLSLWWLWCKYFAISPYYYFKSTEYERIPNKINNKPEQWDIVIFSKPSATGHIGVVDSANYLTLNVLEQNAWSGNWDWTGSNRIKVGTYSYINCMWRFKKRRRILK